MINCLDMDENSFKCLSLKEQNTILFNNVIEIRNSLRSYKVWKKVTMIIGTALVGGVAYLFKMHL